MTVRSRIRGQLGRVPGAVPLARLTLETIRVCMRYRVTGLASEAGFFALLSRPPLVLGLFGGVGYIGRWLGPGTVHQVTVAIQTYASRFLTDDSMTQVIVPTMDDVLRNGRFDIISFGFVLSLWSGSRALNVFVDTISIMYGQSGVRGIVRTRALSFSLYLVALVVGVIVLPLVLIGPSLLSELLPDRVQFLRLLYWPVVVTVTVASLTTLFHISTPRRSPWLRDVPRRGPHAAHLAPDVVRPASVLGRDRGRYIHLRAAGRTDRRADLVVLSGDRDPHRGGAQCGSAPSLVG